MTSACKTYQSKRIFLYQKDIDEKELCYNVTRLVIIQSAYKRSYLNVVFLIIGGPKVLGKMLGPFRRSCGTVSQPNFL